jgi:uncharacterized membrane protein
MGNVIATIVVVIVLLFFVLWFVSKCMNSINKSSQKMKNHDRCEACKCRLKAVNGQYALTCRRCGHNQSWAMHVNA